MPGMMIDPTAVQAAKQLGFAEGTLTFEDMSAFLAESPAENVKEESSERGWKLVAFRMPGGKLYAIQLDSSVVEIQGEEMIFKNPDDRRVLFEEDLPRFLMDY